MIIKALQIENVKRIRDVKITPENSIVIIGGKNMQGKSTALDSITYALEGKRSIPPDPIHHGAESAEIVLELDGEESLVITRSFTKNDSYLKVTTPEGAPKRSPQKILDSFIDSFIDPLEFEKSPPANQIGILKSLAGLDFTEVENDREAAYARRTEVSRGIKTAEARLKGMTHHGGVYDAPVNVKDLMVLRQEMEAEQQEFIKAELEISRMHSDCDRAVVHVKSLQANVESLEAQLVEAKKNVEIAIEDSQATDSNYLAARKKCDEMEVPDFTDIDAKIAGASDHNSKFEENQRYRQEAAELDNLVEEADILTNSIGEFDHQKKTMIAEADMPVPGLDFSEEGITYNGVVFEQCSQAEKLHISSAIGLALNPKLRVLLIRDGSLLDEDSMELMADIAEKNGAQIFIERVGNADENAIIIEDGMVKQ